MYSLTPVHTYIRLLVCGAETEADLDNLPGRNLCRYVHGNLTGVCTLFLHSYRATFTNHGCEHASPSLSHRGKNPLRSAANFPP